MGQRKVLDASHKEVAKRSRDNCLEEKKLVSMANAY
jgi:hypothetical protein